MSINSYNLKKLPFHTEPDPEFLYLSPSHKKALDSMVRCIDERLGFIVILGDMGLGKTTILRSYKKKAESRNIKVIDINADVSFKSFLLTIYRDLGVKVETGEPFEMVNNLHLRHELIKVCNEGGNIALLIDDAQNMSVETLESLRLLSDLETSEGKLIQVVLAGRPEFEEILNRKELRRLKKLIAVGTKISPLDSEESAAYIEHRLSKALDKEEPVFTGEVLKIIIEKAKGVPGTLNVLSHNLLISSKSNGKEPVKKDVGRAKEATMNILKIVKAYLRQNGYDGLYSPDECVCGLDNLVPCVEFFGDCRPGYKEPCDCGDHDFHIGSKRSPAQQARGDNS